MQSLLDQLTAQAASLEARSAHSPTRCVPNWRGADSLEGVAQIALTLLTLGDKPSRHIPRRLLGWLWAGPMVRC
jgi:hypothetical protein